MWNRPAELLNIGESHQDAIANVVFVHGLGGGPEETWQGNSKDPQTLWPRWLYDDLNGDSPDARPPVNVWSLGYPAETFRMLFFSKNRNDSMPQRARNLTDILINAEIADRPVLFVTHSLGGIMVKQMLRSSVDAKQTSTSAKLATSTRLVLFLATPHTGSSMANLAGPTRGSKRHGGRRAGKHREMPTDTRAGYRNKNSCPRGFEAGAIHCGA